MSVFNGILQAATGRFLYIAGALGDIVSRVSLRQKTKHAILIPREYRT